MPAKSPESKLGKLSRLQQTVAVIRHQCGSPVRAEESRFKNVEESLMYKEGCPSVFSEVSFIHIAVADLSSLVCR
jgi:hypothetical protein